MGLQMVCCVQKILKKTFLRPSAYRNFHISSFVLFFLFPFPSRAVEDLKMLIAPDAATLISQGDSLVLETHGKQGSLSRVVMKSQIILREKFREVQQSK